MEYLGHAAVFILRLIGQNPYDYRENLVLAAQIVEWIGRFFPTFCLGKGLLFAFNIDFLELLYGKKLNAFDPEVMLYEVIFLAIECVAYTALAIFLDRLSGNPEAMLFLQRVFCCRRPSELSAIAETPDDDDVITEQERILKGEANEDSIVISELTKVYPNGKVAVNRLSLGIAPGEVFGLLGINGAGYVCSHSKYGFNSVVEFLTMVLAFLSSKGKRRHWECLLQRCVPLFFLSPTVS